MTTYRVRGFVTVSCWTDVEAESEEEAVEVAGSRALADLCHQPFSGEADECFHFDNDGEPGQLSAEEL